MESQDPNPEDVKKAQMLVAKGLMDLCQAPLTTTMKCLTELTDKQNSIQYMLESDRRRLENLQINAKLDAMMSDITTSKEKLKNIIYSMQCLQKKAHSLSARADHVETLAKTRSKSDKSKT